MYGQRALTRPRHAAAIIASLVLGGCYLELAANYYPKVDGGDRVAESGWGFGINIGAGLKYRRVHAAFGRGYEVAVARYEDATGKGNVAHRSPYNLRLDIQAVRLVRDLWADLTVGGAFGQGTAKATYDDGVVADPNYEGSNITAQTRSVFAGPTLHYDEGQEADYLLTLAPAMFESTSDAFDPLKAYGVTFRLVYQMGLRPKPLQWTGLNLFRSGRRSSDDLQRSFQKDQSDFNRRQQELKDRERERRDQERKEKERECQQSKDC